MTHGPRPHRRRDPPPHPLGRSALTPTHDRVGARDDVLRRAGQRRQRRIHLSPDRRPPQLRGRPRSSERINEPSSERTVTVHASDVILDPYDYDFHEDPYPYYKRLRDEAPLYHNDELGFWALSRHQDVLQGFRNSTTLSNKFGVSLDPVSRGPHAQQDDVVPGDGRSRPSAAAHPGVEGLHPAPHPRAGAAGHRARRAASRHDAGEGRTGGTVDYVAEFAGKLPMDVISELMGVPVEDRDRIRAMGRRRDAPRGRRQRTCHRRRSRRRST